MLEQDFDFDFSGNTLAAPSHYIPPPVWSGHMRLIDFSLSAKRGMSVKLALKIQPNLLHPFHGEKIGAHAGQHYFAQFSTLNFEGDDVLPIYEGEVALSWWQHDASGHLITLKLDDTSDGYRINPFQALHADRDTGDMVAGIFKRVNEHGATRVRRRFADMSPAQQSHILCKNDENFQDWVLATASEVGVMQSCGESKADAAARAVRVLCGVKSRSEFSSGNQAAINSWNRLYSMFKGDTAA